MVRLLGRCFGGFGLALSLALFAPSARADSASDEAAARSLFTDARSLMQAGRYGEACPRLEESARLAPGIGTKFNLADCYEHTGRIASAWAAFLDVAASAKMKRQDEREKAARDRAAALEPRLSRLSVSVASEERPLGLEVRRDGTLVREGQWDVGVPADPGPHVVVATAPGHVAWQGTVTLDAVSDAKNILVPRLVRELPPAPRTTAASAPSPVSVAFAPTTEPSGRGDTQRALALVTGGLGLVTLGIGTYFGLRSISKHDAATPNCFEGDACNDAGITFRKEAMDAGNVGTAAFVVGGVALVGATVLWFTAPSGQKGSAVRASVDLGSGRAGLNLRGSF